MIEGFLNIYVLFLLNASLQLDLKRDCVLKRSCINFTRQQKCT